MTTFIDRIYESAFIPEIFEDIIRELSLMLDCEKGFVFSTKDGLSVDSYVEDKYSTDFVRKLIDSGYIKNNPQAPSLIKLSEPRFVNDLDIFTEEEINTLHRGFYHDFMKENGAFWGAGTLIRGPSGENVVYSFHRPYSRGPVPKSLVDRMTLLRPHLARSAFIAARLRMREAQKLVTALEELGLPAATVSSSGRLHVANAHFNALVPSVLMDYATRIRFVNEAADQRFQNCIIQLKASDTGRGSSTFAVSASLKSGTPFVVHLTAISGNSRDIFVGATWLMIAIPVVVKSPDPLVLEGLFDLTVAESHVARGIAAGRSIDVIAQSRKTTIETVRSQLKAVMLKTATTKQSELAALLQGAIPFPSSGSAEDH